TRAEQGQHQHRGHDAGDQHRRELPQQMRRRACRPAESHVGPAQSASPEQVYPDRDEPGHRTARQHGQRDDRQPEPDDPGRLEPEHADDHDDDEADAVQQDPRQCSDRHPASDRRGPAAGGGLVRAGGLGSGGCGCHAPQCADQRRESATRQGASVAASICSSVTPSTSSTRVRPSASRSNTPSSVMVPATQPRPVSGRVVSATILDEPFLATWSITTTIRRAPTTRSMAPPMPLTMAPGTIQLAMSPAGLTSMAPRIATSILPERIMPKLMAESKMADPGRVVTVSLPALIRSGSTSSGCGYGPMPSSPFSDCSVTVTPSGT